MLRGLFGNGRSAIPVAVLLWGTTPNHAGGTRPGEQETAG
jgi:hypothetical protein